MRSSISASSSVSTTTILNSAAAPGLGLYGDGADGALSLGANTEIADGPPICRRYSTGDLAGYYLSGRSQAYGSLILYFSGQLNMNAGAIYAPGDGNTAAIGGNSAAPTMAGAGGGAGRVGSGPHEDHGREALYVYAKTIIGTGTISAKGGDGTAGSTASVTPNTNTNGNPAASGTQTTICKGTSYSGVGGGLSRGNGGLGDQSVPSNATGGVPNNANNTVGFLNDIKDCSPFTLLTGGSGPYATTGHRRNAVTPDGGGGGAGGCSIGWPPGYYACGGGGGAGGSFRQSPGGGAGGQGAAGVQCTAVLQTSGAGGGGGGGLPGGIVLVITESAPATLTVTANGGTGGNAGNQNGAGAQTGGGGGGGGGGEGGIAMLICQGSNPAPPTATAAGGGAGTKGTGGTGAADGSAGQAGWAMNLRKDT